MELKDKRILVTGGTGFLGQALCVEMQARGLDPIVVSRGQRHPIELIKTQYCELMDRFSVRQMMIQCKPDVIIHLAAACGGIGANQENPGRYFYENMQMGLNIIEAAREFHVEKFVQVGTICFPDNIVVNGLIPKKISNIKTGDLVYTDKCRLREVVETSIRDYTGNLTKIRIAGSPVITVTPEHPFLTTDGFVKASELTTNHVLLQPIIKGVEGTVSLLTSDEILKYNFYKDRDNYNISTIASQAVVSYETARSWKLNKYAPVISIIPQIEIDKKSIAWLSGVYLAEGFISKDGPKRRGTSYTVFFTPGFDDEFNRRINTEFKRLFGQQLNEDERRTSMWLYAGNRVARRFFRQFYACQPFKSNNKIIPEMLLNADNDALRELLCGYWNGDGHYTPRHDRDGQYLAVCSSTSRALIWQIKTVLLRFGIHCGIHVRPGGEQIIEGRKVIRKKSYTIRITGKWAIKFYEDILQIKLDDKNFIERSNDPIIDDNYVRYPIRSIELTSYIGKVYNLSVKDDETYTANGIIVHNCAYPKFTPIPFKEEDLWNGYPEETNAPYGIAKKALLVMLQAYRQQYNMNGIYLLPVNLYGPRDNFDLFSSHVIPALIRKFAIARDNREPSVKCWGTGFPSREFLYVDDCASGILAATERYDKPDPINLGNGREITIGSLAELIKDVVGYKGEIVWDPSKPDGQPKRCLDTEKAKKEFGWSAAVDLEEGIRRTYEWFHKVNYA